jgi:hypothetical protein
MEKCLAHAPMIRAPGHMGSMYPCDGVLPLALTRLSALGHMERSLRSSTLVGGIALSIEHYTPQNRCSLNSNRIFSICINKKQHSPFGQCIVVSMFVILRG